MSSKADIKLIVSNIVSGKQYSHCRLCLKSIEDYYVRFGDGVALDSDTEELSFQPLSEVLTKLLGAEVIEEITGLEAVCTDCVDQALKTIKFMENCQRSTEILHNVLDNLLLTLNVDIVEDTNQTLYIVPGEKDSELILTNNNDRPLFKKLNRTPELKLTCLTCTEEFASRSELKSHCRQYHNTCEHCGQSFETVEELSGHACSSKFQCEYCKQYRSTEEALSEHQARAHEVHVCKDCGKSCNGLDKLKAHEEKHYSKSQCPKCGKCYATKGFYLKHVKLCTEGLLDPHPYRTNLNKQFSCKECGKSYSTPGGLRVHYRFEHGDSKPHICPHCGKKFTAPSYLKVHMITHTKEKNFECNICSNRFVSKEALLYHTRRHTGEKPYQCDICFERFVNASARAEHIKYKHIGPTLMCEICSKKFVTPNFLKMHIKRHHEKNSEWNTQTEHPIDVTVKNELL